MRKSLAFGFATLLLSKLAQGQTPAAELSSAPPFSLEVQRDELAVSCPDVPWFRTRVASHAGEAGQAGSFKVTLGKQGSSWRARIQRWERNTGKPAAERVLQDQSTACEPLAEAVAVTVAILADDYAQRVEQEPAPEPPKPPEKQPSSPSPPPSPPPREAEHAHLWVGAAGGVAMSWISPVAPVLGFGLALDSTHLRQQLRLMLTTEQKFELDPGRVVVQAWLATVLSCVRAAHGSFGAALCGAVDISMVRASAEGFDDGRPSTRSYEAIGLEAQPSWHIGKHYRLSAALSALVPFTRESFSVTGRGVAYVPPALNWRVLLISELGAF